MLTHAWHRTVTVTSIIVYTASHACVCTSAAVLTVWLSDCLSPTKPVQCHCVASNTEQWHVRCNAVQLISTSTSVTPSHPLTPPLDGFHLSSILPFPFTFLSHFFLFFCPYCTVQWCTCSWSFSLPPRRQHPPSLPLPHGGSLKRNLS